LDTRVRPHHASGDVTEWANGSGVSFILMTMKPLASGGASSILQAGRNFHAVEGLGLVSGAWPASPRCRWIAAHCTRHPHTCWLTA